MLKRLFIHQVISYVLLRHLFILFSLSSLIIQMLVIIWLVVVVMLLFWIFFVSGVSLLFPAELAECSWFSILYLNSTGRVFKFINNTKIILVSFLFSVLWFYFYWFLLLYCGLLLSCSFFVLSEMKFIIIAFKTFSC